MNIQASGEETRWKRLFVGLDGLRAGWNILVFLALTVLFAFLLLGITRVLPAYKTADPHGIAFLIDGMKLAPPELTAAWAIWNALPFALATCAMVVLSRQGWAAVGVGLTGAAPRFLEGLAVGFGSLALLVAGLCFAGALIIDHVNFSRPGIALWGLRWAFAFLIVGLAEELIFRGYIFRTLLRGLNFWWAAALTSVWFMTFHIHNDGETAMGLAGVTLFGAICA